jgi:cell division septal protein FtsQ
MSHKDFRDEHKREDELWERLLEVAERGIRILEHIDRKVPNRFSIQIQEIIPMAIGNINAGSTGQLGLVLLENGSPYVAPAGSTYDFSPTLSASDSSVTFAPATTDASGGTIPLADQVVVTVPAGDPGDTVTITATAADPNGNPATGSITITLTPEPQTFTIAVTQLA